MKAGAIVTVPHASGPGVTPWRYVGPFPLYPGGPVWDRFDSLDGAVQRWVRP